VNLPARWLPRSILCLRGYSRAQLGRDLTAGITVGLVALPLALGFAIASGVTPQAGLYTAVVAGFLISALSGSSVQIGGPTGAFIVIVAGIVGRFGTSGLALVTAMAGAMLVLMGICGLGAAVRFIPRPVTIGFTNGIAVLIASTQIRDLLGMRTPSWPAAFLPKMRILAAHWQSTGGPTLALGAATLALLLLLRRAAPRLPGAIVAVLLATLAAAWLHLPVETIGSRFGGIPLGFPRPSLPRFEAGQILPLLPSAFTVAMLAAVESLLSAVVADGMIGERHNSNVELVAQGVANLASPLFGGIPATGAIARTATNVRSGGRTPVAGMVHALTLLAILLAAAPLARFIPLTALAAVLVLVAYNMGEWREIPLILRLSPADIAVWLATFSLTVLADLTVAVGTGMALAALLYIYRIAETTTVEVVTPDYVSAGQPHSLQDKQIPPGITILRIHGPFLFGATEQLAAATESLDSFAPIVILRLRNMTALDATGLHAIERFAERLRASGRTLLLCGARPQPARILRQADFVARVGEANILPHIEAALERARALQSAARPAAGG
jgi:SulP family sulfate permease